MSSTSGISNLRRVEADRVDLDADRAETSVRVREEIEAKSVRLEDASKERLAWMNILGREESNVGQFYLYVEVGLRVFQPASSLS